MLNINGLKLPMIANRIVSGTVAFVDYTTGLDDPNYGDKPNKPFKTWDYADSKLTASKGDHIILMPGHAETIATATALTLATAGVTTIGLGNGALRPTITLATATTADVNIDAANIAIENVLFANNIDSLVGGIDVNAAGASLINCECKSPTLTNDALMWVITDANAVDMTIRGCVFRQSNAGPTECIRLVGATRARILENFIIGSYSTGVINGITTASLELLISWNTICNSVIDKHAVVLVAGCTGRIEYNSGTVVSTAAITDANIIAAANCQLVQNYFSDAVGETGKLIGTVSA